MLIEIFLKTVNMSLGAVPLMLAVLILRAIFKKAVPRKVFYFAWILVFIRLMVPFSFESDLSFFGFLPESYVTEAPGGSSIEFITDRGETLDFPVLSHPSEDNPNVDAVMPEQYLEEETVPLTPPQQVTSPAVTRSPVEKNLVFATAWAFGTAALLVFGVIGYVAVLQKIKKESVSYANNILLCDFFTTPMVCGFVKPKIILPLTFDFDDESKTRSVLSHENTHIKRLDNLRRLLASFTLYVHWFNPLVWVCYWAFIRDMEVSCDEEVLQKSRSDIRGSYAESLVALAGAGTNPLYGGVLSFGETAIKERVKCIMNFKKAKLFIIIICVAVAAALGVIFLTNPAAPSANNSFEVIADDIREITYNGEDTEQLSFRFENRSSRTLYIDNTAKVYRYLPENEKWHEIDGAQGTGSGITAVPAKETVKLTEIMTPYFMNGTLGRKSGEYRLNYGVYTDVDKKNLIGEAEITFTMTLALESYAAKNEEFTAPYMSKITKTRFAEHSQTENDLNGIKSILERVDPEQLMNFSAVLQNGDGETLKIEATKDIIAKFTELLQKTDPQIIEATDPDTKKDPFYIYFRSGDEEFYIHYDGRISLYSSYDNEGMIFGVGNEKAVDDIYALFDEIFANAEESEQPYALPAFVASQYKYLPKNTPEHEGDVFTGRENLGDEKKAEYFEKLISGANTSVLSEFSVISLPYESDIYAQISKEEADEFLSYLKRVKVLPGKEENPSTGGAIYIYIKYDDEAFTVRYDGRISFAEKGYSPSTVFCLDAEGERLFRKIRELADEILEKNIKKENASLGFTGFVTTKDTFVSSVPIPAEKALGTESNRGDARAAIDSVTENNITGMYVMPFAENSRYEVPLTKKQALRIADLLKGAGLEVLKAMPNPTMAGGVAVHIETKDTAFAVNYSGGTVSFTGKGQNKTYVFGDSLADQVFGAILEIVGEATENAFQTAVPAEGTFLPSDTEIDTVTIFNNTEKLCVPAASNTEDPAYMLYDIIKYSNFTNYGMSTEVSETELTPLTGVDTVEFARTDGKKYTLKLYETGFVLSGSAVDPSEKRVWLVEEKAWKEFKRIARECYSEWPEKHPSWLGLLHFNNVVGAEADFRCENVQNYTAEDSCLNELLSVVKYVQVKGPGKKVDPTTFHGYNIDHLSISIEFRTGVFYTVYFDESMTKFKIGSTDMSYALEYEVTSASQNYYTRLKSFALPDANAEANPSTAKPVIYLYPEKETEVSVKLDFNGKLTYTYPALNDGWKVTAKPDGSIINKADGSLYRYLFWEGVADYPWAIDKGFVVAGKDTEAFLVDALTKMGLKSYEIADFVTYWAPRMIENKYNLISFSGSEYAEIAKLTVDPAPDTVIRIHMLWKALEAPVKVAPQVLPSYERSGFTLVEWGGTEIK